MDGKGRAESDGVMAGQRATEPPLTPGEIAALPMLDDLQLGHLRHIVNLAGRLPDDWSGMQSRTTLQEDFGSLRFQLAYMSYALALTHAHRLPAAPCVFKAPFEQLIDKMRSPDVWTYWHYVSTGGGPFNKSLGELPPRWDPIAQDNIMYSAYLQSMALLYHHLFDDDRYARDGALTLSINPLFWSQGGKHFVYDERSLNEHIYWNMVERGYLGIACEPNCVFQICNQVPILGFRFHDLVYGGDTAREVTDGYLRAWEDFGVLDPRGHYSMLVLEHERRVIVAEDAPWTDFWMAALMHAWNPDFVKTHYPRQIARWAVDGPDRTLFVRPGKALSPNGPSSARDMGWAAVCASEVGDLEARDRILAYADRYLQPSWERGGLYYPRRDETADGDGLPIAMDPHTGNALLAYARLNVPDGLSRLYAGALDAGHHEAPALAAVSPGVAVRRAVFDPARRQLVLTLDPAADGEVLRLELQRVWSRGAWSLLAGDAELAAGDAVAVRRTSGAAARREGERLVVDIPARSRISLSLAWETVP